jgi:hypothetical protein
VDTGAVLYVLEKRNISFPGIQNPDRPDRILTTIPTGNPASSCLYRMNEVLSRGGKCESASSC